MTTLTAAHEALNNARAAMDSATTRAERDAAINAIYSAKAAIGRLAITEAQEREFARNASGVSLRFAYA